MENLPRALDSLPPQLREQIPINQAIAGSFIRGLPTHWRSANLRLVWDTDTSAMTLHITSPDATEPPTASAELQAAAEQLNAFRQKYRAAWADATFAVALAEGQQWSVSLEFS